MKAFIAAITILACASLPAAAQTVDSGPVLTIPDTTAGWTIIPLMPTVLQCPMPVAPLRQGDSMPVAQQKNEPPKSIPSKPAAMPTAKAACRNPLDTNRTRR